ncbi:MAG: hypothetical protein ACLQVD_19155 [Capsulimonadaceae bacterium]
MPQFDISDLGGQLVLKVPKGEGDWIPSIIVRGSGAFAALMLILSVVVLLAAHGQGFVVLLLIAILATAFCLWRIRTERDSVCADTYRFDRPGDRFTLNGKLVCAVHDLTRVEVHELRGTTDLGEIADRYALRVGTLESIKIDLPSKDNLEIEHLAAKIAEYLRVRVAYECPSREGQSRERKKQAAPVRPQ